MRVKVAVRRVVFTGVATEPHDVSGLLFGPRLILHGEQRDDLPNLFVRQLGGRVVVITRLISFDVEHGLFLPFVGAWRHPRT